MKRLKRLREERGFSQDEVAQFIGVSRQMYNKYENSEVDPSLNSVKLLSKIFNVSYETLLNDEVTYNNVKNNDLVVASSSSSYGSMNINYFTKIVNMLPKLLYLEKTKLLNLVAQSMAKDVEAGKMAHQQNSSNKEKDICSYAEFELAYNTISELTTKNNFNSKGQKWTREELHER